MSLQEHIAIIDDLFDAIPRLPHAHATSGAVWRLWNRLARQSVVECFSSPEGAPIPFGPFGPLNFPYVAMGNVTSLDLFGLDELILFAFYAANRGRYKRVVDFGANIGLHSIILARCGFDVRAFEPDPVHISLYERNLELNKVKTDLHKAAVSLDAGHLEFVRVLGNTTGSHLSGAKANPYGELARFSVPVEAAAPHLEWADLAKIDIEGHEAALVCGLPPEVWLSTDAVMEVGTAANAAAIFDHLSGGPVNMFSQKRNWGRVQTVDDLPTSHREGSLFVTGKPQMPW